MAKQLTAAKGNKGIAGPKIPGKVQPAAQQEDVDFDMAMPLARSGSGRGRRTRVATYNVAICNYNDWRTFGKWIANGLARTKADGEGGILFGHVEGEIIAGHVQNRNLDYVSENAQKYGGFVVCAEADIPAVIKNIEDFYNDPINEGVKIMFRILPEFPLTHPVSSNQPIKNTGMVATAGKGKTAQRGVSDRLRITAAELEEMQA